jgi:hypothetical protein
VKEQYVPLGGNIDDEKDLPLVGAEVNIFPTCILQAQIEPLLVAQFTK